VTRARLIWQIYGLLLIVFCAGIAVTVWVAVTTLQRSHHDQTGAALVATGAWVAEQLDRPIRNGDRDEVRRVSDELSGNSNLRITVVGRDGDVWADSHAEPKAMDNHGFRPEIAQAFRGVNATSRRFSETLQQDRMYAAIPVTENGTALAAVRVSIPAAVDGAGAIEDAYWRVVFVAAAVVAFAAVAGFLMARRLTRAIEAIKEGAHRLSRGQDISRLPRPASPELAEVVSAINNMARELERRVASAEERRNELEAVMRSMVEGIVAFDAAGRILNINRAAAIFFDVDPKRIVGLTIEEAVRNSELQSFARRTLASSTIIEGEVVVYQEGQRYLQAHGAVLRDVNGKEIGGVIALNDVTRLRRLEQARRDFVANVSHELRTPITSIKGYVETLLDGAIEDPQAARSFLETVQRQAERLNGLIEDLLTLSRIEREDDIESLERRMTRILDVINGAVAACRSAANERGAMVHIDCDPGLEIMLNPPLMEQAVSNLLENAIKYSEPDSPIEISAEGTDEIVRITVRDYGCGIAPDHIPRLFERFYRVDKARSRNLGGTGLGLSIVKHIVRVHAGTVSVNSLLGQGSTFVIELPMVRAASESGELDPALTEP